MQLDQMQPQENSIAAEPSDEPVGKGAMREWWDFFWNDWLTVGKIIRWSVAVYLGYLSLNDHALTTAGSVLCALGAVLCMVSDWD